IQAALTASDASNGFDGKFTGNAPNPVSAGFTGLNVLNAGSGANTLTGRNVDSTWTLGTSLTYTDATATLTFSNFGTLLGGVAVDTFDITQSNSAILKGGEGKDVFHIVGAAFLTGEIDGGAGANALTGPDLP